MKSIINFMLLFILVFAGIDMASASEELTFERILLVNDWGSVLGTTSSIDKIINDAAYVNADVIMVQMTSEYFESARDPNKRSWDYRADDNYNGMPMLEYFIQQSHEKGIRVHAWSSINIVNHESDAEYRLFGPSAGYLYNTVSPTGIKYTTIPYRQDISFIGLQDYEIGLWTWVASNYPTLDGLHIEEPLLFEYSYSPPVRQKVQTKFGYDILNPGSRTVDQVHQDITSVQRDSWNEFFTKLRSSINANKANPNFMISANHWSVWYDSLEPFGLDPQYLADNNLIDFFVCQLNSNDLNIFSNDVQLTANAITSIPMIAQTAIYYNDRINDTEPPNPAFFDEVRYACDYGADGVAMFAWHWLETFNGGYIEGQNIMDTLHNMPPSSSKVSPPPVPSDQELIISEITAASGEKYGLNTLDTGKLQYIDRDYTFSSVPSLYADLKYIWTANDDKASIDNTFLEFDVNQDVTVYVAHDDRISPKPFWFASFTDTGDDLVGKGGTFSLYANNYSAGHISLGGNSGDSYSMYNVILKPLKLIITNITAANGKNYSLDTLSTGKRQYIDRTYIFSSVPSSCEGLNYIRTANDDKASSGNTFLEFNVNQDVTIYVAHDDRISPKPSWLASFTDTGEDLVGGKGTFSLYANNFPSGHISLGGNSGDSTFSSMYTVVLKPLTDSTFVNNPS